MVKFAAKLRANIIRGWEDEYVDYDRLKLLVRRIKDVAQPKIVNTWSDEEANDNYEATGSEEESLMFKAKKSRRASRVYFTYGTTSSDNIREQIEKFETAIEEEAAKVEAHYRTILAECEAQLEKLREHSDFKRRRTKSRAATIDADAFDDDVQLPAHVLTAESIKWAFTEVYREITFLHSYTILNYTAFVKIIKKHDKATGFNKKQVLMQKVHKYKDGFCDALDVLRLLNEVETLVAENFYESDVVLARSELVVKKDATQYLEFYLGAKFGVIMILSTWLLWNVCTDLFLEQKRHMPPSIVRVYRAEGIFFLCFWCWYVCVRTFSKFRVNYRYMFEFDPRHTYDQTELLEYCMQHSMVYTGNMLFYYKVLRGEIVFMPHRNAHMIPIALVVYTIFVMIAPVSNTTGTLKVLWQVLLSPFYEVKFFSAFVGDVLTSLIRPIVDTTYVLCYAIFSEWDRPDPDEPALSSSNGVCGEGSIFREIIVPIVTILPLWFRLAQNLRRTFDTRTRHPHLANAGKYAVAMTVTLFGAIHASLLQHADESTIRGIWCVMLSLSTAYTYVWDIRFDWGLGERKHRWIREQRMFASRRFYYAAMILDLFLRLTWSLTVIPFEAYSNNHFGAFQWFVVDIVAICEVLRRCMWILLRVEYEHLSNSQNYRRVDFIPLHFETPLSDHHNRAKDRSMFSVVIELIVFVALVLGFLLWAAM